MYEYVEKFNALEKSCCNLGLPEKLLVEYMLDDLRRLDRKLLDASAGGNLMNLSLAGVRRKIMAVVESERFQDESNKEEEFSRTRNVSKVELPSNAMAEEIRQLKEMMQQVIRRQPVRVKPCGFCAATDHKTDECPTIVEDDQAEVNAREPAQQPIPHQAQPYYKPPFRQQQGQNGPSQYQQRQDRNQASPNQHDSSKSLEDIVKDLATSVHQFQIKTDGAITDLSKQMSNLVQDMSELRKDPGRLPSQTVPNPRRNVIMVEVVDVDATLKESAYWVNRMLEPVVTEARYSEEEPSPESTKPTEDVSPLLPEEEPATALDPGALGTAQPGPDLTAEIFKTHGSSCAIQVVASEGRMTDKDELEGRLETRLKQNGPMMEHPLATSHEASPGKSKDPGAFTVTCGIGEAQIHHCLIDLGAAVNVMPYSLYCSLNLGPLKPPKLLIELGDKSCTRHDGLLKNLTLRVGDLFVPADFYVLQMGDARDDKPPALILGRPFLHTTKTKIDMGKGLLSLAFGGKTSDFYVYEDADRPCTRKPPDIVHTSDFGALVPDLPEQTVHTIGPAATAKMSSPSREYVKAKPPDQWRANPSTSFHEDFGQIEGVTGAKYDLTRPWDPNL
ncbi:unnamed protein product [Rhodiola kirilowii]